MGDIGDVVPQRELDFIRKRIRDEYREARRRRLGGWKCRGGGAGRTCGRIRG